MLCVSTLLTMRRVACVLLRGCVSLLWPLGTVASVVRPTVCSYLIWFRWWGWGYVLRRRIRVRSGNLGRSLHTFIVSFYPGYCSVNGRMYLLCLGVSTWHGPIHPRIVSARMLCWRLSPLLLLLHRRMVLDRRCPLALCLRGGTLVSLGRCVEGQSIRRECDKWLCAYLRRAAVLLVVALS